MEIMKDYYKTLGINKGASKDEIKKAFHKVAHQYHPDKGGGEEASKKFKEASEAYSVLSDDGKRKQYDMFGSAGPGGAGFNGGGGPGAGGYGGFGGAGGFNPSGFGGFDFSGFQQGANGGVEFDLGDIFNEFFGGGGGRRRPRKGATINIDLQISFKESIFGTDKDISVNGQTISVKIPAGIENGQGLRIKDRGEKGEGGPGDLIVRIWVSEHPHLRKEALNLVSDLEIKITTAISGGVVVIDILDGAIDLKIPAGTNHGDILRVRGKGVPYSDGGMFGTQPKRGDLLVVIKIVVPRKLSKNAQRLIDELKKEGL